MTSIGRIVFLVTGLLMSMLPGEASGSPADSTKTTFFINPRLHSAGYFPFTGALLNHDPVFDINVFFERKMFGFFIFQSVDLVDRHSSVNYLQPGVFATFRIHPRFSFRTFFGYIFSQTQGFKDPDSDYYVAATFMWDLAEHLRVENTILYYDFSFQDKLANRLLIRWTVRKFKAETFFWYRAVVGEGQPAVSASFALTGPDIKLSRKTSLQFTAAYMGYLTTYRPSFALSDGFIFTMAMPVNVLPR